MPVRTSVVVAGGLALLSIVGIATIFGEPLASLVAPPTETSPEGSPAVAKTDPRAAGRSGSGAVPTPSPAAPPRAGAAAAPTFRANSDAGS